MVAVAEMCQTLSHRGPDNGGAWHDCAAGVVLGHRRLSIIDLSSDGSQPMVSPGGRYVITFNGEIYNYRELRRELRRVNFRGHSDTEVMLAAIEVWGLDRALERFIGMFAFGLWDRQERALFLVRDRLGIKPLYYSRLKDGVAFASELRAITRYPAVPTEIDRGAIALFLRHKCVPAPYSIYSAVRKLEPGHVLRIGEGPLSADVLKAFWSADRLLERSPDVLFAGSEDEAEEALHDLLLDAVKLRLVADVPIGAFLSGGVDSSIVVALMQAVSSRRVRTYTVGFHNAQYDESVPARRVAEALGTEHQEIALTDQDAVRVVPTIAGIFDEPFADSSQIPTFLVAAGAREEVTVALSGDGGDEVFGGYNRHVWGSRVWRVLSRVPRSAQRLGRAMALGVDSDVWDTVIRPFGALSRRAFEHRTPGQKLHKLAALVGATSPQDVYFGLSTLWKDPYAVVCRSSNTADLATRLRSDYAPIPAAEFANWMMYADLISYLPDDILTKVDRATMAVGLEARVPLLDHRVVEFAWTLPLSMKLRRGRGKWLLRRVLQRYLPLHLIERPKAGFGVPLRDWLRGPLRAWAEELLDRRALADGGFFDPAVVRHMWDDFVAGRQRTEYHLWAVLMFQAWYGCRADRPSVLAR